MAIRKLVVVGCVLLLVAACSPENAPALPAESAAQTPDTLVNVDWSVYLGDAGRRHYSPLTQITRDNVGQLSLAWSYNSGERSGTMYTSPVVKDGVLYGLSPRLHAFALDAATGDELWRYDPELPGGRFVSGVTMGIRFIGVCIPWQSAHVSTGRKDRKSWEDHLIYCRHLTGIIEKYRKEETTSV